MSKEYAADFTSSMRNVAGSNVFLQKNIREVNTNNGGIFTLIQLRELILRSLRNCVSIT